MDNKKIKDLCKNINNLEGHIKDEQEKLKVLDKGD